MTCLGRGNTELGHIIYERRGIDELFGTGFIKSRRETDGKLEMLGSYSSAIPDQVYNANLLVSAGIPIVY